MVEKTSSSLGLEESRIRDVYARRQGAERYSWFNPAYQMMIQERERRILALLQQHGVTSFDNLSILEIGCGTGYWLREFIKWGAKPKNVAGIELLPGRVEEARILSPEGVSIKCGSAAELPFLDQQFDLVLQSTVFSSVLDSSMKCQIAREMARVVKNTGGILWYDFHVNNPWNPDVRGIKKPEIFRLFPGWRCALQRITLAPPIIRCLAPYSPLGCHILENFKMLNTHYLGLITKQQI
jgi:ubiquinone/menaquinone biosynthesis C-methylase UbiE